MLNISALQNLTIAKRLGLLITGAITGLLLLTAIALWSERSLILEERQNAVRQTVEVAHSLIAHYQNQAAQGKISEADAKQAAMAAASLA